jgi:hypothetical protein
MTLNGRLSTRLDAGTFHITLDETTEMPQSLGLDVMHIERSLRQLLFTLDVPDAPTNPELHEREVHARGPQWKDLARIGLRFASTATSEAEVERLLREQQDIHGLHAMGHHLETSMCAC